MVTIVNTTRIEIIKECKYEEYSPDANGYCQCCWDDLCSDEKCPYGKYKEGWEGKCLECLYPPYVPYDDYSDEPYNDYIEYSPYHDTCGGVCTIPAKGASIPEGHEDTFQQAFLFAKKFLQKKSYKRCMTLKITFLLELRKLVGNILVCLLGSLMGKRNTISKLIAQK